MKTLLMAALMFAAGMTTCRGGQIIVKNKFLACVNEYPVKTVDDLLAAYAACMPSDLILQIFFWGQE